MKDKQSRDAWGQGQYAIRANSSARLQRLTVDDDIFGGVGNCGSLPKGATRFGVERSSIDRAKR